MHSKRADAFSPLVSDTCIVGFVVVCIFKDEGVRNVEWFKKLWMIHHLLPFHPKDDPLAAAGATLYDKQPRFGWRGISHRALWQGEQFDFGLAAGTELEKRLVGHVSSIIYYYNLIYRQSKVNFIGCFISISISVSTCEGRRVVSLYRMAL